MAQNGTTAFPVSLRPPLDGKVDENDDLVSKIRLINQQRDGFRNVTEQSLQLEMNELHDGATSDSESEAGSEGGEPKGTVESVFSKRMQMMQSLRQARDTGLFALDTLSLTASRALEPSFQTASPAIKESVPSGSLSFRKRDGAHQPADPERERKKSQLSLGSYMTNTTEAADTLLAAAARLEGLVKAETEYWGQLLSLTTNGWPVYKPGTTEPMHVRFVANEASPYYKMQGVARLIPDKDGIIKLGSRVGAEPRTLRLRLRKAGEVVASSVTTSLLSLTDLGSSLEDKVRKEQSSLFEEELFHEMTLESRTLQPLGVKLRENVLHLPLTGSSNGQDEYLIDLIPVDEASDRTAGMSEGFKDLLDAQAVLLRLLLCHVYDQRLQRRSNPPPPLTLDARKSPPSNIIRTFMTLTQHQLAYRPLAAFFTGIGEAMSKADIPFAWSNPKLPGVHEILQKMTNGENLKTRSILHRLLEGITDPQITTAEWKFTELTANGATIVHNVVIRIRTNLAPPMFGTEFDIEMPQGIARLRYGVESHDKKVTFSTLPELVDYLSSLLSMQVTRHVLLPQCSGWTSRPDLPVLEKTMGKNGSSQETVIGVRIDERGVELRRRQFGPQGGQDIELWSKDSSPAQSLMTAFKAWTAES